MSAERAPSAKAVALRKYREAMKIREGRSRSWPGATLQDGPQRSGVVGKEKGARQ